MLGVTHGAGLLGGAARGGHTDITNTPAARESRPHTPPSPATQHRGKSPAECRFEVKGHVVKSTRYSPTIMTQSGSSSVTLVRTEPGDVLPDKTLTHRITSNMNGVRPTTTTTTSNTTTSKDSSSGYGADTKQHRLRSYQRAIFVAMFLGYACYTYNRKSVSYATPTLLATGLITTSTVGVISSCQNMAYAVSKFLGGVLSDKMSARVLFSMATITTTKT